MIELTNEEILVVNSEYEKRKKSLIITYILLWFAGMFGVHRFYLNKKDTGIIQLVLTITAFVTMIFFIGIILLLIVMIWVMVDIYLVIGYVSEINTKLEKDITAEILSRRNKKVASVEIIDEERSEF